MSSEWSHHDWVRRVVANYSRRVGHERGAMHHAQMLTNTSAVSSCAWVGTQVCVGANACTSISESQITKIGNWCRVKCSCSITTFYMHSIYLFFEFEVTLFQRLLVVKLSLKVSIRDWIVHDRMQAWRYRS